MLTFSGVYNIILLLMKKLLTVALSKNSMGNVAPPEEEIEVITISEDTAKNSKALYELLKQAKSKYTVIADTDFTFADVDEFLKELNDRNEDIILFDGGYCFKTTLLKGLPPKVCVDRYGAEIFASFEAKSLSAVRLKPFIFTTVHTEYSEEIEARLKEALDEFKRSKAKLNKTVYSFVFDMLCARLVTFYISAMLKIRNGELDCEKLKAFDAGLKENVILYLALEKRFTLANLSKLRAKDFKIGFIEYNKFKKAVKK